MTFKEKIGQHLTDRKEFYIRVGIGVGVAGITALIMRSSIPRGGMRESVARGAASNTASHSFLFRSPQVVNITTVLDQGGRGHPGFPVRNLETKRLFFSQREAAMAFDIPESVLSGHLKGKFPDVDGLHFERANLLPA